MQATAIPTPAVPAAEQQQHQAEEKKGVPYDQLTVGVVKEAGKKERR